MHFKNKSQKIMHVHIIFIF